MTDYRAMIEYLALRKENKHGTYWTVSMSFDNNIVIYVEDEDEKTSFVYNRDGKMIKEVHHNWNGMSEEMLNG